MSWALPRILILGTPRLPDYADEDTATAVQVALTSLRFDISIVRDEVEAQKLLEAEEWDLLIATSLLFWGRKPIFQDPPKYVRRVALSMNPALFDFTSVYSPEAFVRNPFVPEQLVTVVKSLLGRL